MVKEGEVNNKTGFFRNPWFLGLLIFVIGGAINFLFRSIFKIRHHDLGFLLVAYYIGYFYSKKTGYEISKIDRLKSTSILFAIYFILILGISVILEMDTSTQVKLPPSFIWMVRIIPFIFVILISGLVYFCLGFSGRMYLKTQKKK